MRAACRYSAYHHSHPTLTERLRALEGFKSAAASASIAQVHRAKLRAQDGGGWVAVKIQKPDVGKQVGWDLGAFKIVMWIYEKYLFDLPVLFVVGACVRRAPGLLPHSTRRRLHLGPPAARAGL